MNSSDVTCGSWGDVQNGNVMAFGAAWLAVVGGVAVVAITVEIRIAHDYEVVKHALTADIGFET
ncbi:hypothetical protein [Haladaptatus sp. NG-SE-30]